MTTAEVVTVTADPGGTPGSGRGAEAALLRLLEAEGLPVRARRMVVADEADATRAVRQAVEGGGLVVCFGEGDGEDVLRHALARLLGVRLVLSDRVLEALTSAYAERGQAMPRRAERLALVPQGMVPLIAPGARAPGLLAETGGAVVLVLPNEEAEAAERLAREHLLSRLPRRDAESVTRWRTLRLVGLARAEVEARLARALREATLGPGDGGEAEVTVARIVEVEGELWVRLRLRGRTPAEVQARATRTEAALRGELGVAWYGADGEPLEAVVGRNLAARGLTIALAESCTGGLIGHRLTQVPGSSAYLERGFVVYSNAAKMALLGVPEAVLRQHGAVSRECAEAMAQGARRQAGTDLGVSVTGIAGPEGGSAEKPVGLVFIGLADRAGPTVERHRFTGDRELNKALAATMALDLVRRYCLGAL